MFIFCHVFEMTITNTGPHKFSNGKARQCVSVGRVRQMLLYTGCPIFTAG